jgi:hypothetical protein
LQFRLFDQGLNGSHGQSQQLGCIGRAAVIFRAFGSDVCTHVFILSKNDFENKKIKKMFIVFVINRFITKAVKIRGSARRCKALPPQAATPEPILKICLKSV